MSLLAEWVTLMRATDQPTLLLTLTVLCFLTLGPQPPQGHLAPPFTNTVLNGQLQSLEPGICLDLWIQCI